MIFHIFWNDGTNLRGTITEICDDIQKSLDVPDAKVVTTAVYKWAETCDLGSAVQVKDCTVVRVGFIHRWIVETVSVIKEA